MCAGQPADIRLDAYPDLKLSGHVSSIGAARDRNSRSSRPRNANGNWVKVTQRVPVRIDVDGNPPRAMIAGLSAKVHREVHEVRPRAAQPRQNRLMALHDDQPHLVAKHKGLLTVAIMSAMVMQVLDTDDHQRRPAQHDVRARRGAGHDQLGC